LLHFWSLVIPAWWTIVAEHSRISHWRTCGQCLTRCPQFLRTLLRPADIRTKKQLHFFSGSVFGVGVWGEFRRTCWQHLCDKRNDLAFCLRYLLCLLVPSAGDSMVEKKCWPRCRYRTMILMMGSNRTETAGRTKNTATRPVAANRWDANADNQ